MRPPDRIAAAAAFTVGLGSVAALAVGFLLLSKLGGTSGRDLGGAAAAGAFADAVPLLVAAEMLKLITAGAQLVAVRSTAAHAEAARRTLVTAGYSGALLIAASGIFGLSAVATQSRDMASLISTPGFYGIAATGLWAILLVLQGGFEFRRWLAVAGVLFGAACLVALAVPPVAMLSGILGWAWWFGLAAHLRRRP
jgi:hypothetical protein